MGARITQIPVNHHARQFGHSKYGLERIVKVMLDLMVVKFLHRHLVKPIYVFGGFAMISWVICGLSILWALALKFSGEASLIQTPLPLLAVMTFLIGFISLLMGLIAEILTRTYYESQDRKTYLVRELVNFPG
jgi:dolichol-phosphate mannosyltransferase